MIAVGVAGIIAMWLVILAGSASDHEQLIGIQLVVMLAVIVVISAGVAVTY
jgi:hypothetical protein